MALVHVQVVRLALALAGDGCVDDKKSCPPASLHSLTLAFWSCDLSEIVSMRMQPVCVSVKGKWLDIER